MGNDGLSIVIKLNNNSIWNKSEIFYVTSCDTKMHEDWNFTLKNRVIFMKKHKNRAAVHSLDGNPYALCVNFILVKIS